jgi:hypothetical protein
MIIEDGGDWLADQVSWRGRDMVRLSGVRNDGERIGIFKGIDRSFELRGESRLI